jgi:thiol-disulfide isomerase/thioredoxin
MSAVVLVLGLAATGCSAQKESDAALGYVGGDGVIEQVPEDERTELAQVTGRLLDGNAFDSRKLSGLVVVYNVWGSWCVPCREEAPVLRRVSEEYAGQGVRFIGINVRDNDQAAIAFEQSFGISYPSIRTADSGEALLAFGGSVPPGAVPSTIVVDRQGRIAARVIGASSYGTLTTLLDDVLGESGG